MTHSAPLHVSIHSRTHAPVKIIGVASALGAPGAGPDAAPAALEASGLVRRLHALGIDVAWHETLLPDAARPRDATLEERLTAVGGIARRLADSIAKLDDEDFPLVLGGDHAVAMGTWPAVAGRWVIRRW